MVQMDKFKRAVAIGYLEKGYRPSHIAKDLEVTTSSGVEKVVKLWSIFCVYYGQTRRTWPGTRGRNRRGGGTGGCTATRSILDLSLGLGV